MSSFSLGWLGGLMFGGLFLRLTLGQFLILVALVVVLEIFGHRRDLIRLLSSRR